MSENQFYVTDTSSFIDMKIYYNMKVFKKFWEKIERLIQEERLVAPQVVLEELERKDDEIIAWIKNIKSSPFYDCTSFQTDKVAEMLSVFPKLINPKHEHEDADPFVIAMALERRDGPQSTLYPNEIFVITEEKIDRKRGGQNQKVKIPKVCEHYDLPCFSMVEIPVMEGWEF